MATQTDRTSTPIRKPGRAERTGRERAYTLRFGPAPAVLAGASLLCLLIGLLYLASQIRTIFSDQLKQEYAGLVLDAVDRADNARALAVVWQQMPATAQGAAQNTLRARNDLTQRVASLAALVDASPAPAPRVPDAARSSNASLHDIGAMLVTVSAYWRAQRDADSADVRLRIAHVANLLIALAALLFCMLLAALGMYAKRNRQLAGQSLEFEQAALHDPLTGLPNRRKLFTMLDEAARQAGAAPATGMDRRAAVNERGAKANAVSPYRIAVLYVDLDGFKRINDSLGHGVGDEFLVAVSRRFRDSVRKGDVVARIGGDEFAVLVREFSKAEELGEIAQRLIACVLETDAQMRIGWVSASVGIASFPDPVDDYRRLVAAADDAMYQVKRAGKNSYAFAAPSV
ncbi:GGDEF domain-containing protein [Paraburkholderia sp. D15]|uniref:GGDEF domain-containing protein n=1 Tax=Paraburkholderia sp. D15 TaxID=2880218 RepID=UPI00247AC799|nr:GGDEF domain-containing protein [Paraburkholderia sp. D15]WGS53150.1 GGDEF domain-containing protein [Paraburkholderia sp. D15]WKF61407.1 putative signaling protein [Paraburkholderia busanensis]